MSHGPDPTNDFEHQADQRSPNIFREFADFLLHNKKWWIMPILVVLLLFSLMIILSGTPVAPFIYTLF